MRHIRFICGIGLAVLWLGQVVSTWANDVPRVPSVTVPRPVAERVAEVAEPDLEPVVIQLVIVELRGNFQRAMKEAGFTESAAGNRFIFGTEPLKDGESDNLSTLLRTLAAHAEVEILSRPQIRGLMGQSAGVGIGSVRSPIPYLTRTGERTFELREVDVGSTLGITIDLTVRAGDETEQIEISPLKISMKTMDGREQIPGLELDVGKPIVSTRTLETSITLIEGTEVNGIALPGPPGRQPILFLCVRRVKTVIGEPLPKPVSAVPIPVASPVPSTVQPAKPPLSRK